MKYTVSEAGKRLSRLLKEASTGEAVEISGAKELTVRLVPVRNPETASRAKKDRSPGALKGKIFYTKDAFDPLAEQELSDLGFE